MSHDHKEIEEKAKAALPKFRHSGRRPRFHSLWHLHELGVITDLGAFESPFWQAIDGKAPVRVAVIDTLPALTHPNLEDAFELETARDFTRSPAGEELDERSWCNHSFGAHGTAVAGLIAARPQKEIKLLIPPYVGGGDLSGPRIPPIPGQPKDIDLPYCGVNPFSTIIPLVVSAAPNPAMIHGALRHAIRTVKPDIVVIADSWDRDGRDHDGSAPKAPYPRDPRDGYGTPLPEYGKQITPPVTWEHVDEALRVLCWQAIVFCAAGNRPREGLVYPARLSTPTAGPWAVGARRADGTRTTYTPRLAAGSPHRLIETLSSEHPRYDREEDPKLDPWSKTDKELSLNDELFEKNYPVREIVTTDVPGPAGYNPSPYDHVPFDKEKEHLDVASLYCRFSGTSAATALAAGLVSLALALSRVSVRKDEETPAEGYKNEDKMLTLPEAASLLAFGPEALAALAEKEEHQSRADDSAL